MNNELTVIATRTVTDVERTKRSSHLKVLLQKPPCGLRGSFPLALLTATMDRRKRWRRRNLERDIWVVVWMWHDIVCSPTMKVFDGEFTKRNKKLKWNHKVDEMQPNKKGIIALFLQQQQQSTEKWNTFRRIFWKSGGKYFKYYLHHTNLKYFPPHFLKMRRKVFQVLFPWYYGTLKYFPPHFQKKQRRKVFHFSLSRCLCFIHSLIDCCRLILWSALFCIAVSLL